MILFSVVAWLLPSLLASAQVGDDPVICAGADSRFRENRERMGRDEMIRMAAAWRDRCPQLAERILASVPPQPQRSRTEPLQSRPTQPPVQAPRMQPLPPAKPPLEDVPAPLSCEPRVVGHRQFALTALDSGGFQLTAPPGQCPAAGIGETLVVEVDLCGGRASPFSTMRLAFEGRDRNGSRIRTQIELGVATAGPDRNYGIETRFGRRDPRFASGASYARLALHGQGQLRAVAPQLCAIQIQ